MTLAEKINGELQRLVAQSDWRFAVGLRIRFNHPTLMYQTYPEEWVLYYAKNGLLFSDPTLLWGMSHFGTCDWASLEAQDSAGVLERAKAYGLVHGLIVSVGDNTTRSIGFFTHATRPINAAERALGEDVMNKLHAMSEGVTEMDQAQLAPLYALAEELRKTAG
jgi:LuxR family transcriptional regulator, quorum-sensing system regulator SdiA